MGGTNQKEAYAVDLNDILPRLEDIILYEKLSPKLKISRKEYLERVKYGAAHLKGLLGYNNEAYFVIDYRHPSFDYWLGYYLTISDSFEIPLILDCHFEKSGFSIEFINKVKHFVIGNIQSNVFYNVIDHLKEIVNWIRGANVKKRSPSKSSVNNVVINVIQNNYYTVVNDNWTNNSNDEDELEEDEVSTFIKSPFNDYLYSALREYCEKGSVKNLRSLLDRNESNNVIILEPQFKKISLTRAMHFIYGKRMIPYNKKEIAIWMSEKFAIRKSNGTEDAFSYKNCRRELSRYQVQPKNAQIKYEHWKKEEG